MKIWVDADACPKIIKEILFRIAMRTEISIIFVANQYLHLPVSDFIQFILVGEGPDIADDKIAEECDAGDLIVTADIPLAARVVEKDATALDPRGKIYNKSNMGQVLSLRNFMDELRSGGVETGGPKNFGQKDGLKFANKIDKFITQNK